MTLSAPLVGLILIVTLASYVDGGCSLCKKPTDKDRGKRSIDLNDVLNVRPYRLRRELRPINYDLVIKPDIPNAKFTGQVDISAVWVTRGSTIKLDTHHDIRIDDIQITLLGVEAAASVIDVAELKFNRQKSEWVIELAQLMNQNDSCLVHVKYSGNITTNETSGFFRKEYMASNGQTYAFVATQLRPENARRWFPCMDEPEYKATFQLTVTRPKNMIARSNTPILMSSERPGDPTYVTDHFEKTPEISTYQLALMISEFESIAPTIPVEEMENIRLEIKVWGRKEYLDSLAHVPNKIVRIVNYLQRYFQKSIGLPKLDLVAMPMYTATKASDSWGLMFFRESELSSSLVWNTAYELTYQWIGQRITPFRWSDAQVNKAFNSFMASKTTVDIEPDEMEGKWPITMLYSLYYEFGKTFPFSRVAGIRDEATSAKTELVFRMLNYTLGEDLFRRGIRKFIDFSSKQEKIDNQEVTIVRSFFANDIFKHLDDVANETNFHRPPGLTIHSMAASWINRDRVPLVTVVRDYENGNVTFIQTVYLREAPPLSNDKMSYRWDIPIVMITEDKLETIQHKPHIWLMRDMAPIVTIKDVTDQEKFIIVNPEEIGMFPVNYDICNWKMLSNFLQSPRREAIPVLTRAKLLHDSWNLAYAGDLCFETALNMTLFLKNERSHVVWEPVFTMIDHVGRRIEGSDVYPKFQAYVSNLLRPLYTELGETVQPGEPLWKIHMRSLVKNFLCRAGYKPCVAEAREQYKKWMTDDEPDKGNPVANEFICPVFRWGSHEEWKFGLQRVMNFPRNTPERKQSERTYLLKTLAGCPKDKYKIESLLNTAITDHYDNFTDSDIHLIYSMLTGGTVGHATLFEFLRIQWPSVKWRFQNKKHLWNGILNSAITSFNTQEGYNKVFELYQSVKSSLSESDVAVFEKALKSIEKEIEWNKEHLPLIDKWLVAHLTEEDLADKSGNETRELTPMAG